MDDAQGLGGILLRQGRAGAGRQRAHGQRSALEEVPSLHVLYFPRKRRDQDQRVVAKTGPTVEVGRGPENACPLWRFGQSACTVGHRMIANARMYSVTPEVAALWRSLLAAVLGKVDAPIDIVDHAPPAPISELWQRPDKAAVFMCGLPWSLATPRPTLVAAPRPSPAAYGGRACYWTDLVVRADSPFQSLEQTFGHRLALTTPESQSGYAAPLHALMAHGAAKPLYREIIEPRFTPMGALRAVIENKAEVAPIDSYAWALLAKYAPALTAHAP